MDDPSAGDALWTTGWAVVAHVVKHPDLPSPHCGTHPEVARGRSLKGLFPAAGDQAKADYEAWKKAGGKR